ncbi:MAG: twin-arginine translocase TatA/TatE family subunit [Lachnospiraceae bacterium]|nr:twin-arginine translocase TatA/TatE family subunit [Lachnospiraceae bacterium]
MFIAALGRIGVTELLVVLVIVLIVFGPKQLPKLSKTLGQTLKSFKDGMADDEPAQADAQAAAPVQTAAAAPEQASAQATATVQATPAAATVETVQPQDKGVE